MNSLEMPGGVCNRKGCRIHYWVGGKENAPLVVFTHGAGMDHRTWYEQVIEVSKFFKILIWDVRGHGLSQPIGEAFSIREVVEDLIVLLDQLGYEKVIKVGLSMGGYVGQELLFRYPERVDALVVAGATQITARYKKWELVSLRSTIPLFRVLPWEPVKRFIARSSSKQRDVRAYLYESLNTISKENFIHIWSGIVNCLHEQPGYYINKPFLLTHGDGDVAGTIRSRAPAWAKAEPYCSYVVIPGAGHIVNQDNPVVFNKVLMDFLNKYYR